MSNMPPSINLDTKHLQLVHLDKYGFVDLASSKLKNRKSIEGARQAIVIIGIDYLMRVFVLAAWAGRIAPTALCNRIIRTYDNWQPRIMGIEANGLQELFGEGVREEARKQLNNPAIIPVYQSTKVDKEFRIRTRIEPIINSGRLILREGLDDLKQEIEGFPTARTMDIVDALASAIALLPRRPKQKQQSAEIAQLAKYLRNSGVAPHIIEQRIREIELQDAVRCAA